jgi:hypothetical protein
MFLTVACGYGCQEEGRLDHIDDSAPAPAQVTIVGEPVSKPGGAVIKYQVPDDKNLSSVRAVYVRNGEICKTEASLYVDSLTVEGFGDTNAYEVELFSVGKNEKLSDPVKTQIKPLEPSVHTIQTAIAQGFGGVLVTLSKNLSRADLSVVLMIDSVGNGVWQPLHTYYTSSDSIMFVRKNLTDTEKSFAIYVRDRWGNRSDTLISKVTPLKEELLPKKDWTNAALPTDSWQPLNGNNRNGLEAAWDDVVPSGTTVNFFCTTTDAPIPKHVTIDLGHSVIVSSFLLQPRLNWELYTGGFPRIFEFWGSDNPPADGSWDNWHLLGRWEVFKPSGYGIGRNVGPITDEDREYFHYHQEYEILPTAANPDPYLPSRYVRLREIESFASYMTALRTGYTIIGEITIRGQILD